MPLRIITPAADPIEALDPTATAVRLGAADQETAVGELIQQITAAAETVTGMRIWYRGYREVLEGDDTDRLYLNARPIAAVTSVTFDGGDPLNEGTEPDDFEIWPDQGFLYRRHCWDSGEPGWKVDFTAGWWTPSMGATPAPGAVKVEVDRPDVVRAIWEWVALQWQVDTGDRRIKSARLSSMAVEYETNLWAPRSSIATLESLRRVLG